MVDIVESLSLNDRSSLLVNVGDRLGDLRGGGEGLWRSSSELLEDELESA